jgi:hypothetical protein
MKSSQPAIFGKIWRHRGCPVDVNQDASNIKFYRKVCILEVIKFTMIFLSYLHLSS